MLRALDGPLFSMAGLQPPHLIIARLLEPVHVRHHAQRVCRRTFALSCTVHACPHAHHCIFSIALHLAHVDSSTKGIF